MLYKRSTTSPRMKMGIELTIRIAGAIMLCSSHAITSIMIKLNPSIASAIILMSFPRFIVIPPFRNKSFLHLITKEEVFGLFLNILKRDPRINSGQFAPSIRFLLNGNHHSFREMKL